MDNLSLGEKIAAMRKERNMTQANLADIMGVTDKAVSKWERNLSCPDINSLPKLARIFEISVDELISNRDIKESYNINTHYITILLIFKSLALGMGVAVLVLTAMANFKGEVVNINTLCSFLGIGLTSLALSRFKQ